MALSPSHQPTQKRAGTIAVILKGYPRLSETFVAQELRGLEHAGLKLRLYSMRHPTDKTTHPIHAEIEAPVTYLPEYLHHAPLRVLRGFLAARRLPGFRAALSAFLVDLRRDVSRNRFRRFGQACVLAAELPADIDRLYAHFIHTPAAVTRYASLLTGLPWTCSAHAKDIWTSQAWELRANLAAADWVTTCTKAGADHLRSLAPEPATVALIYHGLDLDRFPMAPTRSEPARDGRDAARPVRLLSVGRVVPKKGFDVLLEALALMPSDLAWTWTHIGGGDRRALAEHATRLGISDRVTWRGALGQQDVLAAYRTSDLFVLPCRIADDGDRDGLPNVLVEAQSQGIACISTTVSGVPELVRDGETGVLVAPDDADALAQSIAALIRDARRRETLATAGVARVRTTFDMRAGLAELTRLFAGEAIAAAGPGETPGGECHCNSRAIVEHEPV